MEDPARLAAIDIGTVTTRLLIAEVSRDRVDELYRSTDITHLGEGLTQTGRLSREAMDRVATVIDGYAKKLEAYGVEGHVALATSASRDAENGGEFMAMLSERGIEPRVIDGGTEARLAFRGATLGQEGEGLLIVDLGGGSTELILGSAKRQDGEVSTHIDSARSVDIGSKRLTELFLTSDPPTKWELEEARAYATTQLRPYFDSLRVRPRQVLALAGTATSLAAIHQELAEYDAARVDGYCLSGSDLSDLLEMLAHLPLERRKEVVGLHPGRAPVIVAGALILETIVGMAGLDSAQVSEQDILHGMLLDTFDAMHGIGEDE
jgi:exopolyphosphatase/guanosine-5'-triphosphate,3'-diphosphate pyrophosphatase